ncbi:CHAP domain-containing protein [Staphylococcus simulans]|uniref:COG3942 and LysM peptidoglycan-binding domain-containing protein n=1 Tax=Staphylococcus simulans TaxID=1286 RepID=UPI0021D22C3B|nr:CHAP domain-containing protein [Staphylococcus simulans]UXR37505.1 CHAP domain-containing protein [Staphylococcus simulans]
MKKALLLSASSLTLLTALNGVASAEQTHVVKEDAKLSEVAALFATTTDEIKSLNKLSQDEVKKDTALVLPDTDVVEVKAGDTLKSIAAAHKISLDQLYKLNPGVTHIILPGDILAVSDKGAAHLEALHTGKAVPQTEQKSGQATANYDAPAHATSAPVNYTADAAYNTSYTSYEAPSYNYSQSYSAPTTSYSAPSYQTSAPSYYSGANLYTAGQCTSYAFDRAGGKVGSTWGNANNWANAAAAAGHTVNNIPAAGSIMQSSAGAYGHVAYVEGVNSDGSVRVSEMNYGYGPGVVTSRTISAGQASGYNFIH